MGWGLAVCYQAATIAWEVSPICRATRSRRGGPVGFPQTLPRGERLLHARAEVPVRGTTIDHLYRTAARQLILRRKRDPGSILRGIEVPFEMPFQSRDEHTGNLLLRYHLGRLQLHREAHTRESPIHLQAGPYTVSRRRRVDLLGTLEELWIVLEIAGKVENFARGCANLVRQPYRGHRLVPPLPRALHVYAAIRKLRPLASRAPIP